MVPARRMHHEYAVKPDKVTGFRGTIVTFGKAFTSLLQEGHRHRVTVTVLLETSVNILGYKLISTKERHLVDLVAARTLIKRQEIAAEIVFGLSSVDLISELVLKEEVHTW